MASEGIYPAFALGQRECKLSFKFRGNGATIAAIPQAGNSTGDGILLVNHTATGKYSLTLREQWSACEACIIQYQDPAGGPARLCTPYVTDTVSTTRVITFGVDTIAGAAVDVAATQFINIILQLRNVSPVT